MKGFLKAVLVVKKEGDYFLPEENSLTQMIKFILRRNMGDMNGTPFCKAYIDLKRICNTPSQKGVFFLGCTLPYDFCISPYLPSSPLDGNVSKGTEKSFGYLILLSFLRLLERVEKKQQVMCALTQKATLSLSHLFFLMSLTSRHWFFKEFLRLFFSGFASCTTFV